MFINFLKHPLTKVICLVVVMTFTITTSAQNARANTLSFMNETAIQALLASWVELDGKSTEQTLVKTSIERLFLEEGIHAIELEKQSDLLKGTAKAYVSSAGDPVATAEDLVEKFINLLGPQADVQYQIIPDSTETASGDTQSFLIFLIFLWFVAYFAAGDYVRRALKDLFEQHGEPEYFPEEGKNK